MVWGYLQYVSPKPGKSERKYAVTLVVTHRVTRSSYGNALHNDLSMFGEFEKLPYPYVISISARFHKPSHLLLWNLLNKESSTNSASSSKMQI